MIGPVKAFAIPPNPEVSNLTLVRGHSNLSEARAGLKG